MEQDTLKLASQTELSSPQPEAGVDGNRRNEAGLGVPLGRSGLSHWLTGRGPVLYLVCGLLLGGLLTTWRGESPEAAFFKKVQASATHGQDDCAVATGFLSDGLEAFFFLDFLTGDLQGVFLNTNSGKFAAAFGRNVFADLELEGTREKAKLMIVLGTMNLRKQGAVGFADSVVYVADAKSGKMVAYAIPQPQGSKGRVAANLEFVVLDKVQFRNVAIRQ